MHALVFLPAGYQGGTHALSGRLLPARPAGRLDDVSGEQVAGRRPRRGGKPAILVEPQGARDGDADAEYLNWGPGRNWQTYVSRDLVDYIDSHFRTIASRHGRALVGLSAGGYGAVILGVHHLARFSAIESWSGYFHPTDPTGTVALDRGSDADAHAQIASPEAGRAAPADVLRVLRRPRRLAVSRRERRVRPGAERRARAARFAVYPGGHATSLWEAHGEVWLAAALRHLAPASTDP